MYVIFFPFWKSVIYKSFTSNFIFRCFQMLYFFRKFLKDIFYIFWMNISYVIYFLSSLFAYHCIRIALILRIILLIFFLIKCTDLIDMYMDFIFYNFSSSLSKLIILYKIVSSIYYLYEWDSLYFYTRKFLNI